MGYIRRKIAAIMFIRSVSGTSRRILLKRQFRPFHSQSPVLRIQTIQLVSLPQHDGTNQNRATLKEQSVQAGERVQDGQLIGRVADANNVAVDVYAPRAGLVLEWHCSVNDSVSVGENLVSVDVPDEAATQVQHSALQQAWIEHWNEAANTVDQSFWPRYVTTNENATALMELASLMEQSVSAKQYALRVYERLLLIQANSPEDQAQTHTLIGTLFYRLGDLESSQVHLQHAVRLHKDVSSSKNVLAAAHIHLAAVLNRKGDIDGCFHEFECALKLQQDYCGPEHPVVAASLNNLGAILYSKGDYDGAIQYYQQGLDIHRQVHGEEHVDTAGSYNNIGIAYKHKGDYGKALEFIQKALQIRKALHNNEHPDVAASHYSLAQLLSTINELEASMEQYQAALAIQESIYGRLHPVTASTINNMGAVMYQQQKYTDALELYEKGLSILQQALDKSGNQPELAADVASSYNNIALAQLQLGRHADALESFEAARDLQTRLFGAEHPMLAVTIGGIGNVYKAQGKLNDALKEFQTAHDMLEKSLGSIHPDVASSHNNIGLIYAMKGQYERALKHYEIAKDAFKESLGETHPYVGSSYYNIALVKQQQADVPGAMKNYLEARDAWRSSLGPDHPQTVMSLRAIEDLQTSPAPIKSKT
ncbi:hypothetical protein MPSEU_000402900 [Mayamaea pseudoterrestris]|nr:hypothetical protein MPSEU_000402900 [Mayamaea pseudoterrestris]